MIWRGVSLGRMGCSWCLEMVRVRRCLLDPGESTARQDGSCEPPRDCKTSSSGTRLCCSDREDSQGTTDQRQMRGRHEPDIEQSLRVVPAANVCDIHLLNLCLAFRVSEICQAEEHEKANSPISSCYPIPAQKRLRDLKSRISAQSKKNFVLERDVRYLDSRIALLIQNRMGGEEVSCISWNTTV
jgi:hypothetical protein